MSSGYQVQFTPFTIASSSLLSNVLYGDTLDAIEELTIYGPSALQGTINVQINWTGSDGSYSASEWRNATYKNTTTAITVPAGGCVFFDTHGALAYRLSSSVSESGKTFPVFGAYNVDVKALP